jgi:hypothetical protein
MKKFLLVLLGLVLLACLEIIKTYFILHSTEAEQKHLILSSFFNPKNIWWFRITGWGLINIPVIQCFGSETVKTRIFLSAAIIIYVVIYFYCNYKA